MQQGQLVLQGRLADEDLKVSKEKRVPVAPKDSREISVVPGHLDLRAFKALKENW